jgi:hypothetical protein
MKAGNSLSIFASQSSHENPPKASPSGDHFPAFLKSRIITLSKSTKCHTFADNEWEVGEPLAVRLIVPQHQNYRHSA